jgi:hypothetical protein
MTIETRKEFIYRMLSMISEVQDKPNFNIKDVVNLLEFQLHARDVQVATDFKNKALTKFSLSGLHKNSYADLNNYLELIAKNY